MSKIYRARQTKQPELINSILGESNSNRFSISTSRVLFSVHDGNIRW